MTTDSLLFDFQYILTGRSSKPSKKYPWSVIELFWSVKNFGFGMATFYKMEGDTYSWFCDDEYMGKDFIFKLINDWLKDNPKAPHRSSRRWSKKLLNKQDLFRKFLSGKLKLIMVSDINP